MILDNTNEDGEYQTFPFKYVERAKTTIENNAVVWCDKVLECIQKRFDGDGNKIVDAANQILNCQCWEIEIDFETMKRASGDNSINDESTEDDSEYMIQMVIIQMMMTIRVMSWVLKKKVPPDSTSVDSRHELSSTKDTEASALFTKADFAIDILSKQFEKPLERATL